MFLYYIRYTLFVSVGGLHHASAHISGDDVYRHLKYEGGTHRVQRIPEAGLSSRMQRIHTGTMSVIVLPQPEEVNQLLIRMVGQCIPSHPFARWSRCYLKPCYRYCLGILLVPKCFVQAPASEPQDLWLWKVLVLRPIPHMFKWVIRSNLAEICCCLKWHVNQWWFQWVFQPQHSQSWLLWVSQF